MTAWTKRQLLANAKLHKKPHRKRILKRACEIAEEMGWTEEHDAEILYNALLGMEERLCGHFHAAMFSSAEHYGIEGEKLTKSREV